MPVHPKFPYRLYLVIAEENCPHQPWLEVAEQAILGGVDIIQLREKTADRDEFMRKAKTLKAITDRHGIPLVINDNIEVAVAVDAWGIHVGQSDTPPLQIKEQYGDRFCIGWSLEEEQQLDSPQMQAVDHLGLSPIYATPTKTNTLIEWGLEGIAAMRKRTDKPIIAIGNMNQANAKQAIQAGADTVAVVSAICGQLDARSAAQRLKQLIINRNQHK